MSEQPKYERGISLSIFTSDRKEDFFALAQALVTVLGVDLIVGR
jgi:hypothetical protein